MGINNFFNENLWINIYDIKSNYFKYFRNKKEDLEFKQKLNW